MASDAWKGIPDSLKDETCLSLLKYVRDCVHPEEQIRVNSGRDPVKVKQEYVEQGNEPPAPRFSSFSGVIDLENEETRAVSKTPASNDSVAPSTSIFSSVMLSLDLPGPKVLVHKSRAAYVKKLLEDDEGEEAADPAADGPRAVAAAPEDTTVTAPMFRPAWDLASTDDSTSVSARGAIDPALAAPGAVCKTPLADELADELAEQLIALAAAPEDTTMTAPMFSFAKGLISTDDSTSVSARDAIDPALAAPGAVRKTPLADELAEAPMAVAAAPADSTVTAPKVLPAGHEADSNASDKLGASSAPIPGATLAVVGTRVYLQNPDPSDANPSAGGVVFKVSAKYVAVAFDDNSWAGFPMIVFEELAHMERCDSHSRAQPAHSVMRDAKPLQCCAIVARVQRCGVLCLQVRDNF